MKTKNKGYFILYRFIERIDALILSLKVFLWIKADEQGTISILVKKGKK